MNVRGMRTRSHQASVVAKTLRLMPMATVAWTALTPALRTKTKLKKAFVVVVCPMWTPMRMEPPIVETSARRMPTN